MVCGSLVASLGPKGPRDTAQLFRPFFTPPNDTQTLLSFQCSLQTVSQTINVSHTVGQSISHTEHQSDSLSVSQ